MNTIELLQLLSDIAVKNYNEGIHPDPYAARVAHTLAIEAAAKYSPESADAAAFVAISTMIDLSRHSLQQADLEIQLHDAMKSYNTTDGVRVDTKLTIPAFNMIAEKPDNRSFGRDGSDIYDSTFDSRKSDNYRLALHAACSIYTHSYACARAAYTHAVAVAAQYPVGETRNDVFKKAITARLTSDLLNEPIEPSFLMKILCSDAMKIFGIVLLVAGLAALSLGICGLVMAPVGAAIIAAISISSASVITAGVGMATASGGLFAGRFFAAKKWKNDNEKSMQAVHVINDIDEPMPTMV